MTHGFERYRIVDKLGAGGMGVVYRAERSDGTFTRQVAIKIIPWAGGDQKLLARFRAEREILARLDHPHIARLLDGGETSDGVPYFVMELAEGVPIDEFVHREKLSRRGRIALFRQVCDAVSYAHRNLIVHRDLKPSNVLVTAGAPQGKDMSGQEPRIKLLDFGIARLLDEADSATRSHALTPDYASPEQLFGAPAAVAADVYSLGFLLYELVCNRRPYRPTTSAMDLAQVVCHEAPLPPGPDCDSDLANILLMALRREPERRYTSVAQFSDDLDRWQRGYPVIARRDTILYRSWRFAARNKIAFASGALLLLAAGAGVVSTLRQTRIANQGFNDVRKLSHTYVFDFYDAILQLPGSVAARQLVLKRGLEYLGRLERDAAGDRDLKREMAQAYERIGDVQGRVDFANLGDYNGALVSYSKAYKLNDELLSPAKRALDGDIAIDSGNARAKISRILQMRGEVKAAEEIDRKAIALFEAYSSLSERVRQLLPGNYAVLAGIEGNPGFPNLGRTDEAIALYRKALDGDEAFAKAHPGDDISRQLMLIHYNQMGQMMQALGDGPAAVEWFSKAVVANEERLRQDPNNRTKLLNVARLNNNLAVAYSQVVRSPKDALPFNERAVAVDRAIVAADPNDVQAKLGLGVSLSWEGATFADLGDRTRAVALLNEAVALFESASKGRPDSPPATSRTAYQLRADVLLADGNIGTALNDIRRQLAIDDQILKTNPGDASAERSQAIAWAQTGLLHIALARHNSSAGDWGEALRWYQKAADIYEAQQKAGKFLPLSKRQADSVQRQIALCQAELSR